MRRVIPVLILSVAGLLMACKPPKVGSGMLVEHQAALEGFSRIQAGQAFELDIARAETYSVQIQIDDNLLEHLRLERRGDTLRIGMDPRYSYQPSRGGMRAQIRLPRLAGVDLSGACKARLSGFDATQPLSVELSGASGLSGALVADRLEADLSGASKLELEGRARSARLDLSGASDAELDRFALGSAEVELSGASEALVQVEGRLDVEASGASGLRYLGQPRLGKVETSGASSVRPR